MHTPEKDPTLVRSSPNQLILYWGTVLIKPHLRNTHPNPYYGRYLIYFFYFPSFLIDFNSIITLSELSNFRSVLFSDGSPNTLVTAFLISVSSYKSHFFLMIILITSE